MTRSLPSLSGSPRLVQPSLRAGTWWRWESSWGCTPGRLSVQCPAHSRSEKSILPRDHIHVEGDLRILGRKGWRRGSESNRRIKVLQTSPLPLGYRAICLVLRYYTDEVYTEERSQGKRKLIMLAGNALLPLMVQSDPTMGRRRSSCADKSFNRFYER